MSEKKLCPLCGSESLEYITTKNTVQGDLGNELVIDEIHIKCMECGNEGDFFNENEDKLNKALTKLNETCVNEVLEFFNDKNISYAGIERAVGLPQRTLTKWKNGISTPTAAGVALLKYLRTFPWLIEVAENKFDYNIAQKIFLGTALNKFINSIQFENNGKISLSGDSNTTINFYTHIFADKPQIEQNYIFKVSYGQ